MAYNETPYRKDAMSIRKNQEPSKLEKAISAVLDQMVDVPSESKEFAAMTTQLKKLYRLKAQDAPKRVSPDTLAVVVANVLGILIIVGHERVHIVTSKALAFVMKMR